ncbi:histidine phosphatase family protein [Gordonia sp. VNK21]|uniref:histidine phosphatase family protein n=1 Tax=Gordonia sp. VNK21 TaxID=3382483 RepID=UPI0038D4B6C9
MPLLIVAGRTAPNRAVRFGGEHDGLDERGRADVTALADVVTGALIAGPETSVRESAALLGWSGEPVQTLASLDVGRWRGRRPEDLTPAQLQPFFTDPHAVPHGGESVHAFVERIRAAAGDLTAETVLVVASPVAQALLCSSASSYFSTPVRPAGVYRLEPGGSAHARVSPVRRRR